ncbi:MAG: ferritin-like domain-containing protein [Candidatus Binatia bacterium]
MIELLSYYREAELHGASLLLRLVKLIDDPEAQIKLALHIHEETRHAWLWTKRIHDLGGAPVQVTDGYQTRIGLRTVPRSLIELLALTLVVEERSFTRYKEHAGRPDVDEATLAILKDVSSDEKWHMSWIRQKLFALARAEGDESKAQAAIDKYARIDREVYGELKAKEVAAFGDAVA